MSTNIVYSSLSCNTPYRNKETHQQILQRKSQHQYKFKTSSEFDSEHNKLQFSTPNNQDGLKNIMFGNDIYKKPFKPFDFQAKANILFHQLKRQSANEIQAQQQPLSENRVQTGGARTHRIRPLQNLKLHNQEKTPGEEEVKVDEIQDSQIDVQNQLSQLGNSVILANQIMQKDDDIKQLNEIIKIQEVQRDELKEQIEEQKKHIKILNENVQKEKAVALNQIGVLNQNNQKQETQLKDQKLQIEKQNYNLQQLNENISLANQEITDKNDEIEKLKQELESKNNNLQITNEEIEQAKASLFQQNQENEELKEELRKLNYEKDNQNQIIQELQSQNEIQSYINLEKDQIIIDLKKELEKIQINFQQQNQQIQELTQNYNQLVQNYDISKQKIAQQDKEFKTQQNKLIEIEMELDILKFLDTNITLDVKSYSTNLSSKFQMQLKDSIFDLYILALQQGIHKGSPQDCCLLVPSKNLRFALSEWNKKLQEIFIPNDYNNKTIQVEFSYSR